MDKETKKQMMINEFESSTKYLSKKGFKELCDKYKVQEKDAMFLFSEIKRGNEPSSYTMYQTLVNEGNELEYYNG